MGVDGLEREVIQLRLEVAELRAEVARLRVETAGSKPGGELDRGLWQNMCVTSPCTDTFHYELKSHETEAKHLRWWSSWCPCCKRPLDVTLYMHPRWKTPCSSWQGSWWSSSWGSTPAPELPAPQRYAYTAALWGSAPGFILGALVLGAALRRRGTRHDLVLMHTDDVPRSSLDILAKVWTLRRVEYVKADSSLFMMRGTRFDGVFTKIHALGLTEYEKVLMLDIDLAILRCPDELFDLEAPAAMSRGARGLAHGDPIDGRRFFSPDTVKEGEYIYEWGQSGGINAGVMLLAPSARMYQRALREVTAPLHPEHIPGAGPEQDYLSRLFAPAWRNIHVKYNYQLHQVFIALEASVSIKATEDGDWADAWQPERFTVGEAAEDVCIVHYSGELKLWDRDHLNGETDEAFAERLLRACSPYSCSRWMDLASDDADYEVFGVRVQNGELLSRKEGVNEPLTKYLQEGVGRARAAAVLAARQWREDLQALPELASLPEVPELLERLRKPQWPESADFKRGERVECWHSGGGTWYPVTVDSIHDDNSYAVTYATPGHWGTGERHVRPDWLRRPWREEWPRDDQDPARG